MKKITIAAALILGALSPAAAQNRQTMSMYGPVADCTAEVCTAASAQFCQETGGAVLRCDTTAGFYVPTPGFSSADCSLESCNAAGVLGQTCVDPVGRWDCDGAGAFVLFVGGGSPGGATTQVQFNNAGAFGGDAGMTYNAGTDTLTLAGGLVLSTAGATVDGKDISGQGAFLNEVNDFTEHQTVAAGKRWGLEGSAGDTYSQRDTDLAEVQVTVDGTIATRTSATDWRPPACPADLNDVPFGGLCTEAATGKIRYKGTLEAIP